MAYERVRRESRSRQVQTPQGLLYLPKYLRKAERDEIMHWLATLHPIWEQRYSTRRGPPSGEKQRSLLRPVYWLGNWQFACLGYYEPPRNTKDCAVAAEGYPSVLARIVRDIEERTRRVVPAGDIPRGWQLNTCLINFYGNRMEKGREHDVARVGAHRDVEPGPVASLSLGERAFFQFVRRGPEATPVQNLWLEDSSLQIFGGHFWKNSVLHRVQRVEDKQDLNLPPQIEGFRTRRVNFTFRYVPNADIVPFAALSNTAREDVESYVAELAAYSTFWKAAQEKK